MISKSIEQRLFQSIQNQNYRQIYLEKLKAVRIKCEKKESSKNYFLRKICNKFILLCEEMLSLETLQQSLIIIDLIKQMFMEIYEPNNIENYIVKIRIYIISLKWHRMDFNPIAKATFLKRMKLFLQQFEKHHFFDVLSNDFYSNIERIYQEVIQYQLSQANFIRAIDNCQMCFKILKRQILYLNQIMQEEQKKIYEIMEAKGTLLLNLFYLQFAAKAQTVEICDEQFVLTIYQKYQNIVDAMPLFFETSNITKECLEMIKQSKQRNVQPFFVRPNQSNALPNLKPFKLKLTESVVSNKKHQSQKLHDQLYQSLRFIQSIEQKSVKEIGFYGAQIKAGNQNYNPLEQPRIFNNEKPSRFMTKSNTKNNNDNERKPIIQSHYQKQFVTQQINKGIISVFRIKKVKSFFERMQQNAKNKLINLNIRQLYQQKEKHSRSQSSHMNSKKVIKMFDNGLFIQSKGVQIS